MADNHSAFIEAVAADSSLQEKLNSVADADAVVAIAKEAGFVISAEEVENHLKEKMEDSEEELTDEQLENVAGGAAFIGGLVAGGVGAVYAINHANKRREA
jgi:predicted ribosomally synthesized peptide with nif11-like leader